MLGRLLTYSAGGADDFIAGFFRWNRRNAVPIPVRAWFGPPLDPASGERMERSWRWQFEMNGLAIDDYAQLVGRGVEGLLDDFWPRCRDDAISAGEYRFLLDTLRHAKAHDPYSPFADVHGKVDLLTATIPGLLED